MLGVGEQFDRRVDGRTVRFGTRAYERFLRTSWIDGWRCLGGGVRPVVLVTVPCHHALETGVSKDPVIINDERRVRWLNAVQRRYARSTPTGSDCVDLHGFLCPDGYIDAVGGVDPLRTDGVHFTPPACSSSGGGSARSWWRRRGTRRGVTDGRDHRRRRGSYGSGGTGSAGHPAGDVQEVGRERDEPHEEAVDVATPGTGTRPASRSGSTTSKP